VEDKREFEKTKEWEVINLWKKRLGGGGPSTFIGKIFQLISTGGSFKNRIKTKDTSRK